MSSKKIFQNFQVLVTLVLNCCTDDIFCHGYLQLGLRFMLTFFKNRAMQRN